MTATSPTSQSAPISPERIDASCRQPLFTLFGGAATWLALSSVFGMVASLKFHKPSMFEHCVWLSYGRAFPAWSNLLVYGFCIPAALGIILWLIARLSRTELAQPWLVVVGAKLWHIGVFVGLISILAGQTTGMEWFEMPRYAAVILFFGFMLITLWAFVTYTRRDQTTDHPSQWFAVASLFWFPWIFSTAMLLLQVFPVRGMTQAAIAWWFSGNLLNVWLTLAGFSATLYFLPKLSGRPLQSHYLALFMFWTLILFGTWTGIPAHAALPAWMPALSGVNKMLAIVPALTAAVILLQTVRGSNVKCFGGPLCFVKFGVWSLVLASLLLAATAFPEINRVTDYTWFTQGTNALRIYGFFAMTMFGAIYTILPGIAGADFVCKNKITAHFWLNLIGVLLLAFPLIIGGITQGMKWLNPSVSSVDVLKGSLMALRVSSAGELLILVGNILFLYNVHAAVVGFYKAFGKTVYAEATGLQPAGVKS